MKNYDLKIRKNQIEEMYYNNEKLYSFKDLCDFMNVEPKERTRIGRKVKPYATKITINIDEKDKIFTYVNKTGVLYMIKCIEGIKKYLYYYLLYNKLNNVNLLFNIIFGKINDSFNLFKIDKIINIKTK